MKTKIIFLVIFIFVIPSFNNAATIDELRAKISERSNAIADLEKEKLALTKENNELHLKQKELVEKNKEEVENFIGDVLFLIIKIANQAKIDVDKSIQDVLNEYEKRMPPEIMKKLKHANKKAGGFDEKDGN